MDKKCVIGLVMTIFFSFGGLFANAETVKNEEHKAFFSSGEWNKEFMSSVSKLCRENWKESYFSSICMSIGSSEIVVDGEIVKSEFPITKDDKGRVFLPTKELAEILHDEFRIDEETGEMYIKSNGVEKNISIYAQKENLDYRSEIKKVEISEKNEITRYMNDGSIETQKPIVSSSCVEDLFNIKVKQSGNNIIISDPYQTRQIIVCVHKNQEIEYYNASDVVTAQVRKKRTIEKRPPLW